MKVDVKIANNKKLKKLFLKIPDEICSSESHYISSLKLNTRSALDKKKNPFWATASYELFIAFVEQKPVGRIAAIYSPAHEMIHHENCGYFGFFDSINAQEVANALMNAVSNYLEQFQCSKIIGPLNPSSNYELGVLKSGFDRKPFFMMNYNPPYYEQLLLSIGAKEEMNFKAYELSTQVINDKIQRVSEKITNRFGVQIQDINYSDFNEEAKTLCHIYNDAFSQHWGFLPFSENEFLFMAKSMKMIMDKKLIFKLVYKKETVGFILALPNINEAVEKLSNGELRVWNALHFLRQTKRIKWVKVMVVAIKKKYQPLGWGSLLYTEMAKRVKDLGYDGGELSWVADENDAMNKVILSMGAKAAKTYGVYQFPLETKKPID